jgi:hypothetical protein
MHISHTALIMIGPRDPTTDDYPTQLFDDGAPVATGRLRIDITTLLEAEHRFSAADYGMELYDALFAGRMGRVYTKIVARIGTSDAPRVRVQLCIDPASPELHALPWERLFHLPASQETPIATDSLTPFSRFLITDANPAGPASEHPLRLLMALGNPTNLPGNLQPVDVAVEVASLADALLTPSLRERVRLTILPGRSGLPDELRRRLEEAGCAVIDGPTTLAAILHNGLDHHSLHLVCHGALVTKNNAAEIYLHLEDDQGGFAPVASADLAPKLGNAGLRLIFLAACESAKRPPGGGNAFIGLAPRLVLAGAPAVVAMQDLVPVDLARELAALFYARLFTHGEVDRALNEARNILYERKSFDWAIPALFLRLKDGLLFASPEQPPGAMVSQHIDLRGAQGPVINPTGPVNQTFGPMTVTFSDNDE